MSKSNTTFSKAWLEKKIMCGLCNFGCCNHPSFHVEITEDEQEFYQKEYGLDLELEWKQDGCCKLLKDDNTGCSLGDDRPVFCKLYPLVENNSNRLVMNNWGYLHCPKPQHYELDKIVEGKYHYKLKPKVRKHNKREELILDDEIDNVVHQIWLQSKDSIVERYGQEYYDRIKNEMKETIKHEFF
jgi:Fe-S-cluster containining protein